MVASQRDSTRKLLPTPAGPNQQDKPSCKVPNDRNAYMLIVNLMEKVLDFVQDGGPDYTIGRTIFGMWVGM